MFHSGATKSQTLAREMGKDGFKRRRRNRRNVKGETEENERASPEQETLGGTRLDVEIQEKYQSCGVVTDLYRIFEQIEGKEGQKTEVLVIFCVFSHLIQYVMPWKCTPHVHPSNSGKDKVHI